MAKVLLSVRIPDDLMGEIDALSAKTKRDKTSVTIDLLERGLSSVTESPLTTANYVTVETLETAIAALRSQVDRLEGAIEPYPDVIGKLQNEIETLKKDEPLDQGRV
jgi:predicted transcriptional regulator